MFSKRLGFALGAIIIFLTGIAFIIGRPEHRDSRIYPIIRKYTPFTIEKSLGGLKILRKDSPKFSEEPNAIDFYSRLKTLEQQWAKTHLKLKGMTLKILDNTGQVVKKILLRNEKEKHFVTDYYGITAK